MRQTHSPAVQAAPQLAGRTLRPHLRMRRQGVCKARGLLAGGQPGRAGEKSQEGKA